MSVVDVSTCCITKSNFIRQKVFYHPIEAAIRWADMEDFEDEIMSSYSKQQPYHSVLEDLRQWPNIRFFAERIYDAMINGELSYGRNGIKDRSISLDHPHISIRHIDLKKWLRAYYPTDKPSFLFNEIEQRMISCIDTESVSLLLHERDTLRARNKICYEQIQELEKQVQKLSQPSPKSISLHKRTESSYLVTIAALLWLLLNKSPAGTHYSVFRSLESILDVITVQFHGVPGLSLSNLRSIAAQAKKQLKQQC